MQIKSWKHLSKANSAQVCNDMILTWRGLLDIMWGRGGINMHLLTHNHPFPLEMPCHRFKFLVMNFYFQVWSFIFYSPTKEPQNQKKTTEEPTTLFRWKCSCHRAIPPLVLDLPLLMLLMRPRCTFQNLSKQSRQAGSWRVQVWWKKHPFLTCVNFREFKLLSPGPPRPSQGMQCSSPHKVESQRES